MFEIGDIVELLSGGPPMTVTDRIEPKCSKPYYVCLWFYGDGQLGHANFDPSTLRKANGRQIGFKVTTGEN